jgi:Tfp pilus assembly protein PilN
MLLTQSTPDTVTKGIARVGRLRLFPFLSGGVGVLILVYAALALTLFQQRSTQRELAADMALIHRVLKGNQSSSMARLQAELQHAEARLVAIREAFPDRVSTTPFVTELMQLTQANQLELLSLQGRPSKEQAMGQQQYRLSPFTLKLKGRRSSLQSVLSALEKTKHPLVVRTALLTESQEGPVLEVEVELYNRLSGPPPQTTTSLSGPPKGRGGR